MRDHKGNNNARKNHIDSACNNESHNEIREEESIPANQKNPQKHLFNSYYDIILHEK